MKFRPTSPPIERCNQYLQVLVGELDSLKENHLEEHERIECLNACSQVTEALTAELHGRMTDALAERDILRQMLRQRIAASVVASDSRIDELIDEEMAILKGMRR